MKKLRKGKFNTFSEALELIAKGKIGIVPTDTLYGIVGSALIKEAVEMIYEVRKRELSKPFIILIPNNNSLIKFGIKISESENNFLRFLWPARVSVIFKSQNKKFKYLSRNGDTLAMRVPKFKKLLLGLEKVGPIVAPSANISGQEPFSNLKKAQIKFGNKLDFYVEGTVNYLPSTLIKIEKNSVIILRKE